LVAAGTFTAEPGTGVQGHLFDRVDFLQDTNRPLDFDYNGYWPKTAAELLWPGMDASRLLPPGRRGRGPTPARSGVKRAPPYQSGPYGNEYLAMTTPLYHAGSRTGKTTRGFTTTPPAQIKSRKGTSSPGTWSTSACITWRQPTACRWIRMGTGFGLRGGCQRQRCWTRTWKQAGRLNIPRTVF